ncbi:unnamed protein product [Haemonchus placei]|uniref:Apple domain-containing protein n=1 Tax=Haemonchus placei TaxID=6290 RepID=A0A0N4WSC7_HAEPC|nr:unnamed protein product [Haemonchus placei]
MLLLRAQAATSLWLLFLVQAHGTLSYTFTNEPLEPFVSSIGQYNLTITAESEGGCLKKCLEDYPNCLGVGVEPYYGRIYCFVYVPAYTPAGAYHANPKEVFYRLERDKVDLQCPLVNTVLPA